MPTQQEIQIAEAQIVEEKETISYDTREYPVEVIVDKFNNDEFTIPKYQREFVWREDKQSKFIESIFLDLPVPFLFFADEPETGKLEIVDGSQRVRTLVEFLGDRLILKNLERLDKSNGLKFSDFPLPRQRRFKRKTIRSIELTENASIQVKNDLFGRINTAPYDLTPMEIRKGLFEGEFYDFIKNCSEEELFKELCPISEKREKREERPEMVLRFFAYSDKYQSFVHRVDGFMDKYMEDKHKNGFDRAIMQEEFMRMLRFVEQHFPNGFKKAATHKSTPRVRFEAISVGVNLALRENDELNPPNIRNWLESDEFKELITSDGANSKAKVIGRIEYVRDKLLGND
ncbi:MAG: DUF262 domain-containing protein [Bacteroidota bacterium]